MIVDVPIPSLSPTTTKHGAAKISLPRARANPGERTAETEFRVVRFVPGDQELNLGNARRLWVSVFAVIGCEIPERTHPYYLRAREEVLAQHAALVSAFSEESERASFDHKDIARCWNDTVVSEISQVLPS